MIELKELLNLNNLGGNFKKLYQSVENSNDCMAFGLSRPHKTHISANLGKFVLYIVSDSVAIENVAKELSFYHKQQVQVLPPNDDLLIYRKTYHKKNVGNRVKCLYAMANGKSECCVTTIQAIAGYLPNKNRLVDSVIKIEKGQSIDLYELVEKLLILGYSREQAIDEKNTFCLVGDILSVYPADFDLPVRISFFDDEIESLKTFEPESGMTTGSLDSLEILPHNDLLWSDSSIQTAIEKAQIEIEKMPKEAGVRAKEILDDIKSQNMLTQKHQWLMPYLINKSSTIFDYLPKDCVLVFDEPNMIDNAYNMLIQENMGRVKNLFADGDCLRRHADCVIDKKLVYNKFGEYAKLGFAQLTSANTIFSPKQMFNFSVGVLGNYNVNLKGFFDDVKSYSKSNFMVVICTGDDYKAAAVAKGLKEDDTYCTIVKDCNSWQKGVFVMASELPRGFVYLDQKLVVIGREDIYKQRLVKQEKKTKVFTMPKVNDYVVHEVHGIGRCLGTDRIKTGDIEQDYVIVEYRKGEKLYVPIDQLDRLSRYSGSDVAPKLSIIGGKDFEKVKDNVRKSVKQMAINLVELYANRQKKKGFRYDKDNEWLDEFEASFEFDETPDQILAINDIKSDMERGIIMDRLLCGDVGFGKTEVALRAIFKTVLANKQAVILAPTTILARQHFMTATKRFAQFDIKVEIITRFQSPQQINASLNNLASGKSLVAVATHRILSGDVHFNDLGLLVLDEEQRFGVEHKEKLKLLKTNVNVLSMSATPIPRTLNMALTGIRDISVLETPPHNRIPVQTAVTELTNGLLQDAITRELARDGQVYILYNRVAGIDEFASEVAELLPDARVVVAHGQMDTKILEDRINAFYNKQADVLICTTIIENGIDIPDANTLIVCDADRLGLSQLYQLRGRVGRSNRMAYAYFTVPQNKVLTENSTKRLNAIMDYTELGSGFKIAMRDLEIRGAGNILGKEQHGHIEKVGYDMYCKLLKESVEELQGILPQEEKAVKINVDIDAYLDSSYIPDENQRLRVYKDISEIASVEEKDNFVELLCENYGKAPNQLINLIEIALMKNIAKKFDISQISTKNKSAGFVFYSNKCFKNQALIKTVEGFGDKCMFTMEQNPKLIFDCKWLMNIQKFNLLRDFLFKADKN